MRGRGLLLRVARSQLALLALSVGITILALEIGVRFFVEQPLFPRFVTRREMPNGPAIRQNRPNAVYTHTSADGRWRFSINGNGFRADTDYSLQKDPSLRRVLVLGDSFTAGYEVGQHETYSHLLEDRLRQQGTQVEVINTGMSGMGTAEQYAFLKHEGLRYDPDLIIVGLYANDFADSVRSNLFRLDGSLGLLREDDEYAPATTMSDLLYGVPGYAWVAQNSHLHALLNERAAILVKNALFPADENIEAAGPSAASRELVDALLSAIVDLGQERHIPVIVLDIAGRDGRNNLTKPLARTDGDYFLVAASDFYAGCCKAGVFRPNGHRHWTPEAHATAAEALLSTINSERLLAVPPTTLATR